MGMHGVGVQVARFHVTSNVTRTALTLVAAGLLFTVCGATSGPAFGSPAGRGPSYTVVYETQETGTPALGVISPEAVAAFKVAFAGTAAHVVVCDDQGTTTGNVDCEHQAFADSAAAFAVTQADEDQSLVDEANIPVVGVANDTSAQSFDISAQQGLFVGMAVALHKRGCKRVGQVIDEGGESYAAQVAAAVPWQSVTDAYIPLAAPDLTPQLAKLTQADVQCVDVATLPTQVPQVLTAMNQDDLKVPTAIPGIIVTPSVLTSLGSLANGLIEVVSTPDPSSSSVSGVAAKLRAHHIPVDAASLDSWAIAQIIQDGAAKVHGTVTATKMLSALDSLRHASTDGVLPPLSMRPQPHASDRRDFDTYVQSIVLQNGKPTQPSGFFDIASPLNAISK